ncbi:MAG: hypothetical protein MZW92_73910 [Comamonadaceae bacterium]|nr:hypothetical protein [Comamonadaceae bacterium]
MAEADVYLAYGRDLQAEEILKEAMRAQPGRAWRSASSCSRSTPKRRDTKGLRAARPPQVVRADRSGERRRTGQQGAGAGPRRSTRRTRCTSRAARRRCEVPAPGGRGRRAAGRDARCRTPAMPPAVARPRRRRCRPAGRPSAPAGRRPAISTSTSTRPVEPPAGAAEATQPMPRRPRRPTPTARCRLRAAAGRRPAPAAGCRAGGRASPSCRRRPSTRSTSTCRRLRLDAGRRRRVRRRRAAAADAVGMSRRRSRRLAPTSRRCDFSDFGLGAEPLPAADGATRWRASSNWPRSSARSATSKARATCSRKSSPRPTAR